MKNKKKLGIVTFYNAHNYGAVLQVYALQKVLSEKYDVKIVNYINPTITNVYKVLKFNKQNIYTILKSIIGNVIYYHRNRKRYNAFKDFINNNLNLTRAYNTEKELKEDCPKLDAYITGSDQVWNYDIARNIDVYTLNFGFDSINKISYAASIGEATFYAEYAEQYKNNIKEIKHISVREEQAKTYLEKIIDKEVTVTLDPTLLIDKQEWNKIINVNKKHKEKYIFAYVVEEDKNFYEILNYLSEKTGYKVIHMAKNNKNIKNVLDNAYTQGPIEFVDLIKNAEFVVATSFHATVFSILFHKKFWIIPHLKTGGRVISLLQKLKIEDRVTKNLEEFKNENYNKEINYENVDKILKEERDKSIKWLEKAIED